MKNLYKLILILLIANLGFAQTYIPMPAGYGLPNSINSSCIPFFEYNNNIYCYTTLLSAVQTGDNYGKIAKVNAITNQVIILSGTLIGDQKPFDMKLINGNLYFKTTNYNLFYKIDIMANTFANFLTQFGNGQVLSNYVFSQNKIYFAASGGFTKVYDFFNNTLNDLQYFDTNDNALKNLSLQNFFVHNNNVYATGTYYSGSNQIPPSIFKINSTVTKVFTNPAPINPPFSEQYSKLGGHQELFGLKINDYLLFNITNGTSNSFQTLNLNNDTVNSNFFTNPNPTLQTYCYVLNNLLYINIGGVLYVSNGSNTPTISNAPAFTLSQSFCRNNFMPAYSYSGGGILETPTFIMGQRNNVPTVYELWTSDGTTTNSFNLGSFTTPYSSAVNSAIIISNKIYFLTLENNNLSGKIYQSDRTSLGTYSIFDLSQNNMSAIDSSLLNVDNTIFFTSGNNQGGNKGLYKLDLTTLSNTNFNQNPNLKISPNPTNSTLSIETQEKINSINIIDFLGRKTNITNFENNKIDVSNLQNGVYFLEITTENGLQTQKFIKN